VRRAGRWTVGRTRLAATAKRWIDVLLLGGAAYGIVALIAVSTKTCRRVEALPVWGWVPIVALAAPLVVNAARGRRLGWTGLRHLPCYPPPWIAALLGSALLVVHASVSSLGTKAFGCELAALPSVSRTQTALLSISVVAVVIVAWLGARAAARRSRVGQGSRAGSDAITANTLAADFARLLKWLATDDPVRTPDADVFERYPMAQRLVTHFRNPAKPTVALVGPVGSGKTTVGALAQYELRRVYGESGIEFVSVSVWPYESVEAAVRGILVAVDEVLSRHIVTAPLIGLSSEYAQAVEAAGGVLSAPGRLLRATRSPSEILKTYDEAASAIGLRIVLWVEDLERFAGAASGKSSDTRLAPVRALLAELGACGSIQVVLAVAGTTAQFDLEKLARHVEWIQPVREETALALLRSFRHGCLQTAQVLDPGENSRDELWPDDFDPRRLASAREVGVMSPERALAGLCSTPRALKQGLRACRDAWRHLAGEVDFDDLLMMSLLRVSHVDVFELVNEHIRDLQYGEKKLGETRAQPSGGTRETKFARRLRKPLKTVPRARREAVETILTAVFPRWRDGKTNTKLKPQGFAQERTSYWDRYMYVAPPPDEEGDQRMMRVLVAWRGGRDSGELVRLLLTSLYTPALVRFGQVPTSV
jgi:hypothetical protein